jgi:hypothetical protein
MSPGAGFEGAGLVLMKWAFLEYSDSAGEVSDSATIEGRDGARNDAHDEESEERMRGTPRWRWGYYI